MEYFHVSDESIITRFNNILGQITNEQIDVIDVHSAQIFDIESLFYEYRTFYENKFKEWKDKKIQEIETKYCQKLETIDKNINIMKENIELISDIRSRCFDKVKLKTTLDDIANNRNIKNLVCSTKSSNGLVDMFTSLCDAIFDEMNLNKLKPMKNVYLQRVAQYNVDDFVTNKIQLYSKKEVNTFVNFTKKSICDIDLSKISHINIILHTQNTIIILNDVLCVEDNNVRVNKYAKVCGNANNEYEIILTSWIVKLRNTITNMTYRVELLPNKITITHISSKQKPEPEPCKCCEVEMFYL